MLEFAHGGETQAFAKSIGCKKDEIIDLSSNINFVKPKIKLGFSKINISSYPSYEELYLLIANNYKVKKEQIELFNGGSSAIFSLFKNLHLNHCTIYSPAYLEYKRAAKLFGYEIDLINRFEKKGGKIKKGSLVVFVNPSTPDGKIYNIHNLLKQCKAQDATILIDESFLDFTDAKSASRYIKKYKKLYILKSMTKFYANAGVRVGAIISNKKNIAKLKRYEPLWKLSEFDSAFLQEVLKDKSFKIKAKKKNHKNKKLLKNILLKSSLFEEVFQSKANLILAKLKNQTAKELQDKLKKHKILIRDCGNFDFLDSSFVRFAVKDKKSIEKLKVALNE